MTLAATLVTTRSLSCCTGSLGISWLWHFWRLYIARGDLVAFLTLLHHSITARGDSLVALVTFASSLYYCKLCSCNYNVYKCKYPKYVYTQEYWNHLINKDGEVFWGSGIWRELRAITLKLAYSIMCYVPFYRANNTGPSSVQHYLLDFDKMMQTMSTC